MEKMTWSKPVAVVEQFMPNEYISACFYIACDYGINAGMTGREGPDGHVHRAYTWQGVNTGCGWATSQAITVLSGSLEEESGATIRISEIGARLDDGSITNLPCYFTDANGQNRTGTISGVQDGMTIYWVTDVAYQGSPIWMRHQGTVRYTDGNRPKHS